MPTVDQILAGLRTIANSWQPLAIFWHFYFAGFCVALICGARPLKRTSGILLSLPLLSVSLVAWLSQNPFNGLVYALIGCALIYVSFRLPRENVRIAPMRAMIPGMVMIVFGWVYPHFLNTSSFLAYLYAAPTGVIPCATLSIVIGFALIFGNFQSRAFALIPGIAGLFYGLTGVFQLKVIIDWILLIGAIALLIFAFMKKENLESKIIKETPEKMTAWGIGIRLALVSLGYGVIAAIAHVNDPDLMLMTRTPFVIFPIVGGLLIAIGLTLWALGARIIDKAFRDGKLLTSGVYAIVRNPMYSGLIVFVAPGIALLLRSWPLLTVPVVAYIGFKFLILKEEKYLEEKFGQQFLDYKSKVNSLIPFLKG